MARYLVPPNMEPGVQVQDVGFFRPGTEFSAPDDWTPSRQLVPLDGKAKSALKRAKTDYADRLEESRRVALNRADYKLPKSERDTIMAMADAPEDTGAAPGTAPGPKGSDKPGPDLPEGKEAQKEQQAEESGGKNLPGATPGGKRAADRF